VPARARADHRARPIAGASRRLPMYLASGVRHAVKALEDSSILVTMLVARE
jgi:hypothetical protein